MFFDSENYLHLISLSRIGVYLVNPIHIQINTLILRKNLLRTYMHARTQETFLGNHLYICICIEGADDLRLFYLWTVDSKDSKN